MGGIHFLPNPSDTMQPVLWRQRFSEDIVTRLVTYANSTGDPTISDLELATTVAHHDILVQSIDLRDRTINNLHDNTTFVYWQRKGYTTTKAVAYLLRLQALHKHYHRYVPCHDYLPGVLNAMVDDCSRLWALSNSQLLAHFNATFPQINCWLIASALSKMRSEPASFLHAPVQPTSIVNDGSPFATHSRYLNPFIFDLADPVPILKVFATHYRSGAIVPRGQLVRAGTVDDALHTVGQGFACMGARDIFKTATDEIDFIIQLQIRGWEREDDDPQLASNHGHYLTRIRRKPQQSQHSHFRHHHYHIILSTSTRRVYRHYK
jgi:hypothetical protein